MKPKTLILLALAVVCGLAASYMTSRLLAERTTSKDEDDKVTVLVAKQNLAIGTRITEPEKFFMEKAYVRGEEPKKALRSFDQVKDHRLNKSLTAEQFVAAEDLYDKNSEGLAAVMPAGIRAIAIKVNPECLAGGFVLPNSRVDVLSTIRRGDSDSYTNILLQNMLVLAVDLITSRDPERPAMLASTVTLAAKPEEAEKLALATSMGELRLALRSHNDEELVKSNPIRPQDLVKHDANVPTDPNGDDPTGTRVPSGLGKVPEVPTVALPEPQKEEPLKTPKTFTQIIVNGETITKAVHILGETEAESSTKIEETPGPERKPTPKADKTGSESESTPPKTTKPSSAKSEGK